MSKLYYTDGLDAAIMARDFGVQFKSARGQDLYFDGGADFRILRDTGIYGGEFYYIHPDSIDIFKLQVNDLALYDNSLKVILIDEVDIEHYKGRDIFKIIQRNGKSFFNPEVSDD